jgi:hypothetical protein
MMGRPHTYTPERLNDCLKNAGAKLIKVYKKDQNKNLVEIDQLEVNRDSVIEGDCVCGNQFKKGFRRMFTNSGAFCEKCTTKNRMTKTIEHNLEHHGVEHTLQRRDIREQGLKTMQNTYGEGITNISQVAEIKERKIQTSIKNYGVPYPIQNEEVKQRAEDTCMKNHGVRSPLQNEEIRLRTLNSAFQQKKFVMPSGRIIKVQGYEPFALRDLLKTYTEEQIKVDSERGMPIIMYTTEDGKTHRYYPDIYIAHENRIIEIKSRYTAGEGGRNVILKKEATIAAGFLYEIWCYNEKGQRIDL